LTNPSLIYNVAQLLKEPVGSTRQFPIDSPQAIDDGSTYILPHGQVHLLRTDRGILVCASLEASTDMMCSRCLATYQQPLNMGLEEEFYPSVDIASGQSLRIPEDTEPSTTIDPHHMLDMTEAARQYCLTSQPMKPLCQPDCLGICQTCGSNMNTGSCKCDAPIADMQWGPLTRLLESTHS
jgi:uncharacterized protein